MLRTKSLIIAIWGSVGNEKACKCSIWYSLRSNWSSLSIWRPPTLYGQKQSVAFTAALLCPELSENWRVSHWIYFVCSILDITNFWDPLGTGVNCSWEIEKLSCLSFRSLASRNLTSISCPPISLENLKGREPAISVWQITSEYNVSNIYKIHKSCLFYRMIHIKLVFLESSLRQKYEELNLNSTKILSRYSFP